MRIPLVLALFAACSGSSEAPADPSRAESEPRAAESSGRHDGEGTERAPAPAEGEAVALFAGGCFWCMEGPFEALEGVQSVLSGYTDGDTAAPTYEEVSSGRTGHAEAVRVLYDPSVVTYEELLEVFWHNVDPTDDGGQFCDRGSQYRTGIYPVDAAQRRAAEASKRAVGERLDDAIVTAITDAGPFWIAEAEHQDFYRTNPARYTSYRRGCGRDARLRAIWGSSAGH
jgi:peptide-methionine (S)-S-oxide reductase